MDMLANLFWTVWPFFTSGLVLFLLGTTSIATLAFFYALVRSAPAKVEARCIEMIERSEEIYGEVDALRSEWRRAKLELEAEVEVLDGTIDKLERKRRSIARAGKRRGEVENGNEGPELDRAAMIAQGQLPPGATKEELRRIARVRGMA